MMASGHQKALRPPPAFQTYAADELAREAYYLLHLNERGLYDAMRRACWVNRCIPSDVDGIAIAIRRPADEVRQALTPSVIAQFKAITGADGRTRLMAPDLEDQRREIMHRRGRQSDGATETNRKRWGNGPGKRKSHSDTLSESVRESLLSRDELSGDASSREESKPSLERDDHVSNLPQAHVAPALTDEQRKWVAEYEKGLPELEAHEDAAIRSSAAVEYRRASRGG